MNRAVVNNSLHAFFDHFLQALLERIVAVDECEIAIVGR